MTIVARIGDEAARALVPALEAVEHLNIHHCDISGHGLDALGAVLENVHELNLRGNRISRQGCDVIAETPMPRLSKLWLGGCHLDGAGAELLALSANLARLEFLDFDAPSSLQKHDPAVRDAVPTRRIARMRLVLKRANLGRRKRQGY